MDWWNCRSRSPLSFLSNLQESWRRREKTKLQEVNNGGQRRAKKLWSLWGRRGPFIGPHEKETLQETYPGDSGLPRPETPAQPETPGSFRGVSGQGNRAAPPFRRKNKVSDRRLQSRAGDSGLQKNCRNSKTKTAITFLPGLRFR